MLVIEFRRLLCKKGVYRFLGRFSFLAGSSLFLADWLVLTWKTSFRNYFCWFAICFRKPFISNRPRASHMRLWNYSREARDRFEIISTITPWIVRQEVQLLIYRFYNKFQSLKCLLGASALLISLKNLRKHCEGNHNARIIDVRITWVSNYP